MLAAVFVAEIGDVARFPSAGALCCWAGLTLRHYESDKTVHRGHISKGGGVSDRLCKCVTSILGREDGSERTRDERCDGHFEVGRRSTRAGRAGPVVDAALAEELIERAREQGVELLGENGLLRQMTKAVLERALAEELTEHLGYEPHERSGTAQRPQRHDPEAAAHRGRHASTWRCRGTGTARSSRGWSARASAAWTASTRS